MNQLFNPEGPLMQFITKITYSAYLNILWFLCCLPVFTIGASTTALFYVTLKMAKNEEGNITRAFFRSFRENFKQGTIIWLILLSAGIVLGFDGYILYHMRFSNAFWTVITAVFIVAAIAYAIVMMYIFPLLARFRNTTAAMFKNSIMIGMRFLLCTFLMAVIYFVMILVVVRFFTPAIIFGEGLCALLCSYLLSNILLLCQEQEEG
ncbi:MAG: YesL family protein [Blautia sp.]|nr:YesL family protein [Blautia sp.]MCM1202253.1 YesL family protein [Bacteroides fragilis]